MITFNDLYEAVRKEKYSDIIQKISKSFLQETSDYFKNKREFLANEDDSFSELSLKNKKKLENAISSFKELMRVRKKKILNLAFIAAEVGVGKKDFENMFPHEKTLFEEITRALEVAEKGKDAEMKGNSKTKMKHRLVRFLETVPSFMNVEGEEVGPFKKGEIHNLESDLVEILEKDKGVEVIDYD